MMIARTTTMLRTFARLCVLSLAMAGCASLPHDDARTFILVRHAEKAADDPKDPTLTPAGTARAQRLADMLAHERVVAVYATAYRRTQLTAAPTAASHRLAVRTYDVSLPADAFAAQLLRDHAVGTVLVVGHSNTIPALASALCRCDIAPMRDDEFDRVIRLRVGRDGRVVLVE